MTNYISVIISTYNAEDTLAACLKSLAEQTAPHEVIVVDDGSTDRTVQRAKAFKHVKVIEIGHHGPGSARNRGVRDARGDILVFVDADMTFEQNFLEKLCRPIVLGQTKGTWTREEHVANWDSHLAQAWNLEYTKSRSSRRVPDDYPKASPVFRAIQKSEFDRVSGFDAIGYTDDWTLSKKLGYQATESPGAIMYHKNPNTLAKVFTQAAWIAKRQYKGGELGRLLALCRANIVFSLIVGTYLSVKHSFPFYILFKIWFDFATSFGIIAYWMGGKNAK